MKKKKKILQNAIFLKKYFCFSFFSVNENIFAGRSRLGIRRYGVGSFVFMAFYNGIAIWHILNSMRSTSSVSTFIQELYFPLERACGKNLSRFHFHIFNIYILFFPSYFANSYDDTRPIDIEYSIIAQKLFNLTVKDH